MSYVATIFMFLFKRLYFLDLKGMPYEWLENIKDFRGYISQLFKGTLTPRTPHLSMQRNMFSHLSPDWLVSEHGRRRWTHQFNLSLKASLPLERGMLWLSLRGATTPGWVSNYLGAGRVSKLSWPQMWSYTSKVVKNRMNLIISICSAPASLSVGSKH